MVMKAQLQLPLLTACRDHSVVATATAKRKDTFGQFLRTPRHLILSVMCTAGLHV